ncbi:MAG: hypothetical protein IT462_04535 [Planctomycetes bacterium]|nr:hypothetical protein [Planctomycetota bacterium]
MTDLTDADVLKKFNHIYEQYFAKVEMRADGENIRFIHAEYNHPRFKRDWIPLLFCGVRVECQPTGVAAK